MKDSKYMDAWVLLEQYLFKGMDVPKDILYTIYELVEKYYSDERKFKMDIDKSFRHTTTISNETKEIIEEFEERFVLLAYAVETMPDSREKSLCLTKLQEAKFWAIECLAKKLN